MANNLYKNFGRIAKEVKSNKSSSSKKSNKDVASSYAEKTVKRLPAISKIIIALFFVVGTIASIFACKFICKNDCFEINGKKSISIVIGTKYIDQGVKVIGFGQDISSKVEIEVYKDGEKISSLEDIDTSQVATYQIVYTVNSFRYKDIKLIRTVTVLEDEEVPPEEDAVIEETPEQEEI